MSGWPSSSITAQDPPAFSPSVLGDAAGRSVMAAPATSKPSCPAIWSAWTYIGKLKGVGTLWQVTACDAACSFAFAQVIPSVEAIHCARFLKRVLLPAYRKAGWKLKRVLTDHGSEFKGLFDALCSELGIHHTRTKPRSLLDQRLRREAPRNHPPRALESRLPAPILHIGSRCRSLPPELPGLLQPPATSSGIQTQGTYSSRYLPRCDTVKKNSLGPPKCQHPYEAGQTRQRRFAGESNLW
jgi:hypothetical protein